MKNKRKNMTSKEIRNEFLKFFESKGHKIVPSAPVIPYNDPTLLFTNAGMNQFKDVFLGRGTRDYKRAADTQKCIRVSGKHNDLEEVGRDTYHHTFFEMLGNWSFGDYYKKEAIKWAWELLTDVWKLPKERLWATVFRTDQEAFEIWKSETDINPSHILRFDEKDNFWEMGETGPCGPSSEIHINLSNDYDNPSYVNAGRKECIEIWNLVFIQYNKTESGKLEELPTKHIDTGMGFERICAVLQNKDSNYDTDIFQPLIKTIESISGKSYNEEINQVAMRVIADHIRTLTFAIADGAMPGNEGRGYVLRRILRRAERYGRKLDLSKPFLYKLVDTLGETMGDVFPEILDAKENVKKIIKSEEENFNATLDRGLELFEQIARETKRKNQNIIEGESVFKLYDTYGFPPDLTRILAEETGLEIDENRFNELMNLQKERSRKTTRQKIAGANIITNISDEFNFESLPETQFVGYDTLETEAEVLDIKIKDRNAFVLLNQTPFYVESGGQVNDEGKIQYSDISFEVNDLLKFNNRIFHIFNISETVPFGKGDIVKVSVRRNRRWDIMRNHSATHFLHKALRLILGEHVKQAGSYVGPDRLRFDFTHFSRLEKDEIRDVESLINEKIRENIDLIHHRNIPFEDAEKMGALMFFGDKYGEKVNVVQFGDFTKEFCGGTHVKNSSQIGLFKIINESAVASGVRRIEAVTGRGVELYLNRKLEELAEKEKELSILTEEKKKLQKQINNLLLKEKLDAVKNIAANKTSEEGINIAAGKVDAGNMDELKQMGDELRNTLKSGIGLLVAEFNGKVGMVCIVTDDLIKSRNISAGRIIGKAAKIVGGGGGGKPHLATAGGRDLTKIPRLLNEFHRLVKESLN